MTEEPSLDRLAGELYRATRTLDDCAKMIRDMEFNHGVNVRRIGSALGEIIDIEMEIWKARPDLTPRVAKKEWNRPPEPREERAIRPAVAADEEAVLALIEELFEPPGARPRRYSPERGREGFCHAVRQSEADVLLAVDGDTIVGLASVYADILSIRYGKRCWLQDLVVRKGRRARGVGKLLVDAATDWARERGCTHLELASGAGRIDAHRFYLSQGMAQSMLFTLDVEP